MSYTNGLDKPSDYFNTKLYTGNGSTQSITGVNFQPDWVWIKRRNASSNNILTDAVRGNTKWLESNNSNAEQTGTDRITSFDSDGFGLGSNANVNANTGTFTSWNWLASNTTASNTDGSITSTVSANTTSGFSIVSWTGNGTAGATIGHGLTTPPKVVIIKSRSLVRNWQVGHDSLGWGNYLVLNSTNASTSDTGLFNNTAPNSTVVTLGDYTVLNGSGSTYIAYCFAEKKGFSKAFSYTGNGSTDGTYIHLGFKPAWFMIKKSSASGDSWVIIDNTRFPYNYVDKFIYAEQSDGESGSAERLDILSNGIKLRATHTFINTSGATYIGIAFAENPFVTSTGIPTTAR